ncbi:MAG: hypothetical protein IJN39_01100 [Clostridia bacterium]|nr:hypothetical protein [Clostridia bacterium]
MKIQDFLLKNKKYLIILALGIILLIVGNLPTGSKEATREIKAEFIDEKKLTQVLEQIEGAGRVKVFISYKNDGKKQVAQRVSQTDRGTELSPESVKDDFYITSVETPEITGVLITATGASDLKVKERILRGAKHALGVPYHRISVECGK